MTDEKRADRHEFPNYPYRPQPSDLLLKVDGIMGVGWRARVISSLLSRFVASEPMPTPDEVRKDWDKPGTDDRA